MDTTLWRSLLLPPRRCSSKDWEHRFYQKVLYKVWNVLLCGNLEVFFFIYHLAGRVLLLDIKELPTAALGNNKNKKARKTSKTRFKFPKLKRDQSQEDEKKGQSFALDSPSGCTEAGEFPLFDCEDTSGPQVVCVFELRSRERERANSEEVFHLRLKVTKKECWEGRRTFPAVGTLKINTLRLIQRHFDQVSAAWARKTEHQL